MRCTFFITSRLQYNKNISPTSFLHVQFFHVRHPLAMILHLSETALFYNYLLDISARTPTVAYPTAKSDSGLITNWADQVANAGRSTPSLATFHSPEVGFTPLGPPGPLASGSRSKRSSIYQPEVFEIDDKGDTIATKSSNKRVSTLI